MLAIFYVPESRAGVRFCSPLCEEKCANVRDLFRKNKHRIYFPSPGGCVVIDTNDIRPNVTLPAGDECITLDLVNGLRPRILHRYLSFPSLSGASVGPPKGAVGTKIRFFMENRAQKSVL